MKRKNMTRNALVSSVISLLLCVSMLLGTTFAWFTDEVVTGMNTIAAGNLDVELLADGNKVSSTTKLFDEVELWEPGVVVYENLEVANVGTLALKYQMTLNFGNENDLNGHKLSEVLKVAVIDKVADGAKRTEVLAAAKAAVAADQGAGSLSNFYQIGELEAGKSSDEKAIVIFWDANDNATDNLYNANNGKTTSDGQPLHIDFGVNLQATQLMSEEDSFGNDYDEFSSILPKATVNNLGAKTITATTSFPNGSDATEYDMDVAFQFLPNESYEDAQESAYRYWHADYVVKADKDVTANSMALAGYYAAFCKGYNNDNWVLLKSDEVIPANTEIRLVQMLGGGSISVNYEEICNYGNDGVGFLCGATDLTGENAGTTITVELRLYETTKAPDATSGTANEETGNYEVVGTYSYTFPYTNESVQMLIDKATAGDTVQLPNGHWNNLAVNTNDITIVGGKNVVVDSINLNGHSGVTLKNINFNAAGAQPVSDYKTQRTYACVFGGSNGITVGARDILIDGCTFTGAFANGGAAIAFADRSRPTGGSGNVTIKNCTFDTAGAYYDVYGYYTGTPGMTFTFENNTFASDCQGPSIYLGRLATSEDIVVKNNNFMTKDAIENAVAIQAHSASYTPTLVAEGNTFMS